MIDVAATAALATAAHRAGRFDEAGNLYQRALAQAPDRHDLRQLMGVLELQRGRFDLAEALIREALRQAPGVATYHFNLALVLLRQHKRTAAQHSLSRAVLCDPHHVSAWSTLGRVQHELGVLPPALDALDRALSRDPSPVLSRFNRGRLLLDMGSIERAIADLSATPPSPARDDLLQVAHADALCAKGDISQARATLEQLCEQRDPCAQAVVRLLAMLQAHGEDLKARALLERHGELSCDTLLEWRELARLAREMDAHSSALRALIEAERFRPPDAALLRERGLVELLMGAPADARTTLDRALALDPRDAEALSLRGLAWQEMGERARAKADLDRAWALAPDRPQLAFNLSVWYHAGADEAGERAWLDRALALDPAFEQARANRAYASLLALELAQGWSDYEWRRDGPRHAKRPRLWDGRSRFRHLVLRGEQGIGDQILFSTLVPELLERGDRITLRVHRKLVALLSRSLAGIEVIAQDAPLPEESEASWLPLASVCSLVRPTVESLLQGRSATLLDDATRTQAVRAATRGDAPFVCGLSWRSTRAVIGREKSLPLEQLVHGLLPTTARLVSLQYDLAQEELRPCALAGAPVHDTGVDAYDDLDGLCSVIANCDLVITTSNTTAHLAGAMGREALLLAPFSAGRLWYWSSVDGVNPWYPSMRVFPQAARGDWSAPLHAAGQALRERSEPLQD